MLEIFLKERKMGKADSPGKMAPIMKVILLMVTSMVWEDIILLIQINTTKENFVSRIWKAKVQKLGLMDVDMKETLKMGRKMEKALSNGLQE